jgi:hypothetical protein
MKRVAMKTIGLAILALTTLTLTPASQASKENFDRSKPHLNIGSSGLDGVSIGLSGAGQEHTTSTDQDGQFWFEGLEPGAHKLSIGSLSSDSYPPDPIKIHIQHKDYASTSASKSKKAREIVVVGSKVKDVVRQQSASGKEAFFVKVDSETTTQNASADTTGNDVIGDADSDGAAGQQSGKPKPKPKPKPSTGSNTVQTEIVSLSLHQSGGPPIIFELADPRSAPDSFFDVFFETVPESAPDAFFELDIEVREGRVSGLIRHVKQQQPQRPDRLEIPDRPEKIELPDRPTRG